jgi:MFS transporter, SP family, xylose:H+ symportor
VLWLATYTSAQAMAPLMKYFELTTGSMAEMFWIYSVICVVAVLFGWRFVPETKGKSLEEISNWWRPAASTTKV